MISKCMRFGKQSHNSTGDQYSGIAVQNLTIESVCLRTSIPGIKRRLTTAYVLHYVNALLIWQNNIITPMYQIAFYYNGF